MGGGGGGDGGGKCGGRGGGEGELKIFYIRGFFSRLSERETGI